MKTLVTILEYNSTELTDQLHALLAPYAGEDYDLTVLDNGSTEPVSQHTTFRVDKNVYFGGGLAVMMNYMLENPQYDSLLFLNNDIITTGQNWVKTLKAELKDGYEVISPCNIQPERTQNHWQQMHCWCANKVRPVRWADQQAPLISRKVIERIRDIDPLMYWGWGLDVWFGIICEQEGWKTGIVDYAPIIHLGAAAVKKGIQKGDTEMQAYWRNAEEGQWAFFAKMGIVDKVKEMKHWAETYKYEG